jgi:hypothetical protein
VFRGQRREIDRLRFALVLGSAGKKKLRDDQDADLMTEVLRNVPSP